MPIRIIYFDDQADMAGKAERIQERISRSGQIRCILIGPPESVADFRAIDIPGEGRIDANPPDLFLVDQDLISVNYFGSTLVSEIRSQFPEHPIVIITRRAVLKALGPEKSRQLVEEMQTFDHLVLKDEVEDHPEDVQRLLIDLSEGFRVLRTLGDKTWASLLKAIGADDEEADLLREAAPPMPKRAAEYDPKVSWTVTGAGHWVRGVVKAYPGILYSPLHAATRLGISEESFRRDELQRELAGSIYGGVFASHEPRWWKTRLLSAAQVLVAEQGLEGPLSKAFAQAFQRKYQIELGPARCAWDGAPGADEVCYVLREPVKTEHSLRYYPDSRPGIMDHARVSFRAIQESNEFREEFLDSNGRKLLEKIQSLPDPKPRAA